MATWLIFVIAAGAIGLVFLLMRGLVSVVNPGKVELVTLGRIAAWMLYIYGMLILQLGFEDFIKDPETGRTEDVWVVLTMWYIMFFGLILEKLYGWNDMWEK